MAGRAGGTAVSPLGRAAGFAFENAGVSIIRRICSNGFVFMFPRLLHYLTAFPVGALGLLSMGYCRSPSGVPVLVSLLKCK